MTCSASRGSFPKSSVLKLLLLCLHLCVLWRVSCGQSCSSTGGSGGGGGLDSSTCRRSRSCRADHPLEDEECAPSDRVPVPFPSSLPAGISRCPSDNYYVALRCESLIEVNETLLLENRITSVDVELESIDYRHFAMNMSWDQASNPTGGYELRVKENGYVIDCYCINDPDLRALYLDDTITYDSFLTYHGVSSTRMLSVEVLMLSSSNTLPEDSIKASVTLEWPSSCLDINHSSVTCGLPVYKPPTDLSIYKHLSRSGETTLDIQWKYETAFARPTIFYIEVYSVESALTYVVNNTNSVRIGRLDSSRRYLVHVQPYVHCSGLAHRSHALGCGLWSKSRSPINRLSSFQRQPAGRS